MFKQVRPLILATAAIAMAAPAAADPGKNRGVGWGVGGIPPGHAKKMDRHEEERLQVINNYIVVENPDNYSLPPLPSDELYVRRDNQLYRVARDTATVIEAIGIVSELLN
ncbi:hypothetical protein GQE99_15660 [Maritimibacter sp. DP07]|jgi:hypothetical protein|uniref:Nickel/cobalt transporter regulator n=1 Tax=Maritimibacter harenae TaxID=2606218 RepID=A0A845M333_9RHOB|nr:hypothetical protein [Maritimibacter harenae]MZR14455.1 hypothetical protein [Maritimibacter harenae]